MWGLLLALAAVGGLVGYASKKTEIRKSKELARLELLEELLKQGRLTLDQAEDGLVLARRASRSDLAEKFGRAATLKKQRR
jgi:hypothetical protein